MKLRLSLREALLLCEKHGIRVSRRWDGHYLIFHPNKVFSVNNGRKDTTVPPALAKFLREKEASCTAKSSA